MIREKRRPGRPVWHWLSYGVGVLVVTLAILLLVGMCNARSKPVVHQLKLHMPGLLGGSRPMKVALLADIHLGKTSMTPARLAEIVNQVKASHPDFVLLAGDFVTGHDAPRAAKRAACTHACVAGTSIHAFPKSDPTGENTDRLAGVRFGGISSSVVGLFRACMNQFGVRDCADIAQLTPGVRLRTAINQIAIRGFSSNAGLEKIPSDIPKSC